MFVRVRNKREGLEIRDEEGEQEAGKHSRGRGQGAGPHLAERTVVGV